MKPNMYIMYHLPSVMVSFSVALATIFTKQFSVLHSHAFKAVVVLWDTDILGVCTSILVLCQS